MPHWCRSASDNGIGYHHTRRILLAAPYLWRRRGLAAHDGRTAMARNIHGRILPAVTRWCPLLMFLISLLVYTLRCSVSLAWGWPSLGTAITMVPFGQTGRLASALLGFLQGADAAQPGVR